MKTALKIIVIMAMTMFIVGMVSAAPSTLYSVDFTGTPSSEITPLTVGFTATKVNISPSTYNWEFGDGTGQITSGASVSHTYTTPGKYTVILTASESILDLPGKYATVTKTDYITVYHPLPVSSFTASRDTVVGALEGADITFTSSSTGYIESYEWFIDSVSAGTGDQMTRSFPPVSTPETHEVMLRAYGDGGYDDSDILTITVNPGSPDVDFHALSTVGVKPFTVTFVDDTVGHGIVSYTWGFGDDGFSYDKNPVHTYTQPGTYLVTLMVDAGIYGTGYEQKTGYITVLNTSTDICPPVPVCPTPTICPVVPEKPIDVVGTFKSGTWQLDPVTTNVVHFGLAGDIPVALDVNGDGVTDIGIFRNGRWAFDTDKDGTVDKSVRFGITGDIPVIGNFDGTGLDDIGIYRPAYSAWRFDYNLDGVVDDGFIFGNAGGLPVLGNWNNPT